MNLETMQAKIEELAQRITKIESLIMSPQPAIARVVEKKQSAKEFLLTKITKSESQKVLALGYFAEHMDGLASFNVSDLEMRFRAAKEKLPKNLNDAVNKNIARGFLMETEMKKDSKKAWCLTATGERYVENEMTQ